MLQFYCRTRQERNVLYSLPEMKLCMAIIISLNLFLMIQLMDRQLTPDIQEMQQQLMAVTYQL